MTLSRRSILAAPAVLLPPLLPGAAVAQADPRLGERSAGRAEAPLTVIEYFSMTCGHCAAFHNQVWPRVKAELVDTGRVRFVWRDFPLDQLAVQAHAVARAVAPERYEAFIGALMATQDRWAFARGADSLGEMAKVASVAGMSRAQVEAAASDGALQRAVLENRLQGEKEHRVSATPTFVFGTRVQSGGVTFERFRELAGA